MRSGAKAGPVAGPAPGGPSAPPGVGAKIGAGSHVRCHLSIHLDDGTEALSSFDAEPLSLRIGDGTLAPGLESLLMGLAAGAEEVVSAAGSAVFGEPEPALIQVLDPADLPPGPELVPGRVLLFGTPGGQETPGTVVDVGPEGVKIDFNHPLSRCGLRIRIQVLDLAAAEFMPQCTTAPTSPTPRAPRRSPPATADRPGRARPARRGRSGA